MLKEVYIMVWYNGLSQTHDCSITEKPNNRVEQLGVKQYKFSGKIPNTQFVVDLINAAGSIAEFYHVIPPGYELEIV